MIDGELVTLREVRDSDMDVLYEIVADLDTWEERGPRPPAALRRAEYDRRIAEQLGQHPEDTHFVIAVAGAPVGRCDLFNVDPLARSAETGISLHPSARGRGYGTDAMRLLVRFAFVRLNLHRVHLMVVASNAAALASYRRVGFVEEGRRRESAWVRGSYVDMVDMGLLRSEWSG